MIVIGFGHFSLRSDPASNVPNADFQHYIIRNLLGKNEMGQKWHKMIIFMERRKVGWKIKKKGLNSHKQSILQRKMMPFLGKGTVRQCRNQRKYLQASLHRVGFPTASNSVGKEKTIVAPGEVLHQRQPRLLEHVALTRFLAEDTLKEVILRI